MKKKTVLLLSFILSFSAIAFAQTKTVTNADLEKFRQKRLQNEKNYRENYKRLGFPSPEELERKRVEDEENLIEFSQQLEAQRLQREAIRAEIENQYLLLQNQYSPSPEYSNGNSGAYIYGGYVPFSYGYNNYNRYNRRSRFNENRYNRNISPYPWMMIPGFNNQNTRIRRSTMNYSNPRIRTGRGRN